MTDPKLDSTVLVTAFSAGQGARVHYLVVVEGDRAGERCEITAPIVIGRSQPAEWIFQDGRLSRSHCRIVLVMDEVIVTDLGSSNGTYVDGKRIESRAILAPGSRLYVGSLVIEHEWRDRKDVADDESLDRDIRKAGKYIQSLLPAPLVGGPIRARWTLEPSTTLGGDAFGYRFLDERCFVLYLLDVCGHGVGPAMHAVSALNVLRQGALPGRGMRDPAGVLQGINAMFQMSEHGGMYFTAWYGVYDLQTRVLTYASAGHHPSYLVDGAGDRAVPIGTKSPPLGMLPPTHTFSAATTEVAAGSSLYVFSDGVFEVTTPEGRQWGIEDFVSLLTSPTGSLEPAGLLEEVRARSAKADLDDDFTLLAFTFA